MWKPKVSGRSESKEIVEEESKDNSRASIKKQDTHSKNLNAYRNKSTNKINRVI